jgi:hypothetical protein
MHDEDQIVEWVGGRSREVQRVAERYGIQIRFSPASADGAGEK